MAQSNTQLLPVSVQVTGAFPKEGGLSIPVAFNFATLGASIDVDMTQAVGMQFRMSGIQSIFFDNANNDQPAILTATGSGQQIALQAGWQGIFPILTTTSPKFTVTSQGTGIANIQFQNFPQNASQWPANPTNSSSTTIPVSDAILDALVVSGRFNVRTMEAGATYTNRSGAITAGNTAQVLMAANAARRGFLIMNIDETNLEEIGVSMVGTAALATSGTITLSASGGAGYPGGQYQGIGTGAISIIAATTGHQFTAYEW